MRRRRFLSAMATGGALAAAPEQAGAAAPQQVHPGIWKFRLGTPEKITPTSTRHYPPVVDALRGLPAVTTCPANVTGKATARGYLVTIPLAPYEIVYGLGLQLQSFLQRGLKKKLRVNADP